MKINMKKKVIDSLIAIGAIKFGEFTLKSGITSPIYLDLRIIISYPELLKDIANLLIELASGLSFDKIAGIPYTALPMATAFSLKSGVPMIYCRKEKKTHGEVRQIEGIWNPGERVLVIDDLITNGSSKFETFSVFREAGLNVSEAIVLIDRQQGGKDRLRKEGYKLHSMISIFEILDRMRELNQISLKKLKKIREYLEQTKN